MTGLLAAIALIAVLIWLFRPVRPRRTPAPEDEVETPIDQRELEEAERELAEDPDARSLGERADAEDEDDWGPGTR